MIGVGLYVHNSKKAVELYCQVFKCTLGYHVLNKDGSFFHSELMKGNKELIAVVESNRPYNANPVQLGYTFETKEELDAAFILLKENGQVIMERTTLPWSPYACEIIDEFGIDWYLTVQQQRPDDSFYPDNY